MLTLLGPNSDKVLKGITKQSSVLDGLDEEYSHRIIGLQSSTEESPAPVVIIKGSGTKNHSARIAIVCHTRMGRGWIYNRKNLCAMPMEQAWGSRAGSLLLKTTAALSC